jgi:ATP-dependent protease HslVU (ClpYQ) ATPase subunit
MHLHFTPRQIVEKLDQYIIGQKNAKKRWQLRCATVIAEAC